MEKKKCDVEGMLLPDDSEQAELCPECAVEVEPIARDLSLCPACGQVISHEHGYAEILSAQEWNASQQKTNRKAIQ